MKHLDSIKVANQILVNETVLYANKGYTSFKWINATIMYDYFGSSSFGVVDVTHYVLVPIVDSNFTINATEIQVFAIGEYKVFGSAPVDVVSLKTKAYAPFKNEGDSSGYSNGMYNLCFLTSV